MKKKQEDRGRTIMIQTMHQTLILFALLTGAMQSHQKSLHVRTDNMHIQKEENSYVNEDEKLLQELWSVTSDFYKKIIETTVLYFSGILMSSDQFHKQIILETSKHVLYASQIVAKYLPKLLHNPKISWKIKIKRCFYISGILAIIILVTQELRNSHTQDTSPTQRFSIHTSLHEESTSPPTNVMDLQPRQRPCLYS